jgi:flagellar hook assembly protein FlgD
MITCVYSQNDTLQVRLKGGQIEKIDISQIMKIQFENLTSITEEVHIKNQLRIIGNHPNPFNSSTEIKFEIKETGDVQLRIFNISGELINSIKCEHCIAGENSFIWDGNNSNNQKVTNGIYYYEIIFKGEMKAKKLIFLY